MDISINISGVQEGKKYLLEFCISQDGEVIKQSPKKEDRNDGAPCLEDFENENSVEAPKFEEPSVIIDNDIKIESSFDGKIEPI